MKSIRLFLTVVLLSFFTLVFAQSKAAAPQSDAQKSFAVLKSLAIAVAVILAGVPLYAATPPGAFRNLKKISEN